MPHRTFFWFVLPSVLAIFVFIALPIVSVVIQSLFIDHEQVLVEVETCDPFGCSVELQVDASASAKLREERPLGRFNFFGTYTNRNHLAFDQLGEIWQSPGGLTIRSLLDLPFYRALSFTLTYTLIVTPLVVILGFFIALGINALPGLIKGPVIFASLLPMIITPLIGALVLFWMIDTEGILGALLQDLANDPNLSLKASVPLTWIMLIVYGVWHSAPFAFVVFYAGLQTVPQDTVESARIDGANRWQCVRFVTLPHLVPLGTFVIMMQLMDNFRVFEPIVSFNASASATSLSWIIFNDLRGDPGQQFNSAGATSVLTILGVVVLLLPIMRRAWKDFHRKV